MYFTTLALPALMAACIIAPSIVAGMPITKAVAEPDITITSEAVDESLANRATDMDALERGASSLTIPKYFHRTISGKGLDRIKPQTWPLEHWGASSTKVLGKFIDSLRAGKAKLIEKINGDIMILEQLQA